MIDTHCHLDFRQYQDDRATVIKRSLQQLAAMINIGAGLEASRDAVELSRQYDRLYATVGLHPQDTEPENELGLEEQLAVFRKLAEESDKVVAIGEVGLDYTPVPAGERQRERSEQVKLLRRQLDLARDLALPVVIHSRETLDETMAILREHEIERAVFHCFTYGPEEAKQVLDAGYRVSLTGIVTFAKASGVRKTARYLPADRLMVETDAPFLAPVPHRGKRCEPWMVKYVLEKVAQLKEMERGVLERVTDQNAISFFRLKNDLEENV